MDFMGIKKGGNIISGFSFQAGTTFWILVFPLRKTKESCSVCIMFEISIKHAGRAESEQLQAFGSKTNVELYLLAICHLSPQTRSMTCMRLKTKISVESDCSSVLQMCMWNTLSLFINLIFKILKGFLGVLNVFLYYCNSC